MKLKFFGLGLVTGILVAVGFAAVGVWYIKGMQEDALAEVMQEETSELAATVVPFEDWQPEIYNVLDSLQVSTEKELVFVNFWATWCAPCVAEFPHFEQMTQDSLISNNYKFIFASNEKTEKIEKFIRDKRFKLPFYKVAAEKIDTMLYQHKSIPSNYLFDLKNKLVYKTSGSQNWNSALNKQFLKSLIK